MKYSKVRVKCSKELITEIDYFLSLEKRDPAIIDFLNEVKEGIEEKLLLKGIQGEMHDFTYAEFFMTLPRIVYDTARDFLSNNPPDYSELCLFFENIVEIKEYTFRR